MRTLSLRGALALSASALIVACPLVSSAFVSEARAADGFDKQMEAFLQKEENVEKIGNALEKYFQKKRQAAQEAAMKAEQERLESQFKNPVKVDVGDSPVRGNPNAKVTIVEFSDFQCPFCARGAKTMEDVLKEYPNDVKLVFKNLPLPFHPEAKPSAIAALAAQRQGKFWEMHDKLFANQQSLGRDAYLKFAEELGLDMDRFKKDLDDESLEKAVEADHQLATKLGVQGTPGFFVNGVLVSGAQPLPAFKSIIDRWLKKES